MPLSDPAPPEGPYLIITKPDGTKHAWPLPAADEITWPDVVAGIKTDVGYPDGPDADTPDGTHMEPWQSQIAVNIPVASLAGTVTDWHLQ